MASSEGRVAFSVTEQTPAVRFLASLSDGRTIIEDTRPGQPHAWHRLKDYLKENNDLSITCLRLQGPGGAERVMPANQKGYVFGYYGGAIPNGPVQVYQIAVGYYDGATCMVHWVAGPQLQDQRVQRQTAEECGFKLIVNPA